MFRTVLTSAAMKTQASAISTQASATNIENDSGAMAASKVIYDNIADGQNTFGPVTTIDRNAAFLKPKK